MKNDMCGFGSMCMNFTCYTFGSLNNGMMVESSEYSTLCQENYVQSIDGKYYCMPAPVSDRDPMTNKMMAGEECGYTSYMDLSNMQNGTAMNATAECGFNKSPEAWCPVHKGDEIY